MIHETRFDDTFYYLGNERDWPIVREFFFIQCWFHVGVVVNNEDTLANPGSA